MRINSDCFKIDKPNYVMLTTGQQAIWCDVKNKPFPMLITIQQEPVRRDLPLSPKGSPHNDRKRPENYNFIAELIETYYIKNDINLWNNLCFTNLFGIWKPEAPFNRFANCKSNPYDYRIVLLRVSEIFELFPANIIEPASKMLSRINYNYDTNVTIKKPVINNIDFSNLKTNLEKIIKPYIR